MFDVNKPETLTGLAKWWNEFKVRAPVPEDEAEDYCCVVVGNKTDIPEVGEGGGGASQNASSKIVTETDAQRFLEELVPRTAVVGEGVIDASEELDDPFVTDEEELNDVHSNVHANGTIIMPSSLSSTSVLDEALEPESPLRSQSISIQNRTSNLHPFAKINKRVSQSRSSDRSQFGGTMTSTNTTNTIYHTPSSSLFDEYESAQSSPALSPHQSIVDRSLSPANRHARRMTSASSSSSTPTITPSLFLRSRASATAMITPPTPVDNDACSAGRTDSMTQPERRPKLFLTSAKTGDGVAQVFEYIAHRVVARWEYEEAIEARTMHFREGTTDTIRLNQVRSQRSLSDWMSSKSCCGS